MIGIYQLPGANALAAGEGVQAALERLAANFPPGLGYAIIYDTTSFVKASVEEVEHTLIEAFALVMLVVFLFLGSWRATMIPLLAVPVALIGTFAVMLALGFSLNTVSLLAIVLAIGIVVDDAIVVVENVERVMEENPGLSAAEAAHRAMGEITGAIVAITLVLLSVFVPVAFIPGISGQLFQQFAVAVSVSMVLSAINALTLSPALCAILLKPHHGPKRGPLGGSRAGSTARATATSASPASSPAARSSASSSSPSPSARRLALPVVPTGFLPTEDQGAFFVEVRLPEGASVNRTDAAMRQVETALGGIDGVADVVAVTGYSFLDGLAKSNSGFVVVSMLPFDERTDPARSVTAAIASAMRRAPPSARRRFSPSTCRRSSASVPAPASSTSCSTSRAATRSSSPASPAGSPSPPTRTRVSARPSPPSRPARRSSSSTSTASGCRPSASRSATSSPRSRARLARSTSTTSICSAAPGR